MHTGDLEQHFFLRNLSSIIFPQVESRQCGQDNGTLGLLSVTSVGR